ncbi:MAG: hypothetical protein HY738_16685, partial [Bacteroidia bacterium]|nr:hypothetical protein [Bacteroidia bacterium]
FNFPVHKYFSLLGEFNTGTNLNDANLFNIAGNHVLSYTASTKEIKHTDKKSMGFWLNAQSNITDWFGVVIGYGMDKNQSEKFSVGAIEGNSVFYADLVFPIKHGFSLALEFQNISTTCVREIDAESKIKRSTDYSANVINLSAKVAF